MNKKMMIKAIAEKTGYTQKDVAVVVDAMIETVTEVMVAGEDVKVSGLGKFSVSERAAREGRNPQTGEAIEIPATKSIKFKASSTLKNAVKGE